MLGNKSGFGALVKNKAPNVTVTHCMLHRHALAAKALPLTLKEVLSDCVKVVNFIRSRPINHRIFKALFRELGSDHEELLYHSEVRWLSRGEVLKRLQEIKQEVSLFLKDKKCLLSEKFESKSFLYGLSRGAGSGGGAGGAIAPCLLIFLKRGGQREQIVLFKIIISNKFFLVMLYN